MDRLSLQKDPQDFKESIKSSEGFNTDKTSFKDFDQYGIDINSPHQINHFNNVTFSTEQYSKQQTTNDQTENLNFKDSKMKIFKNNFMD